MFMFDFNGVALKYEFLLKEPSGHVTASARI